MSNGAHNDAFPWKDRLEGLESLPGEALMDKTAAWEKLSSRLHGKKRRRYAAWYWPAAAVVLLAVLLPRMFVHQQNDAPTAPPSLPLPAPVKNAVVKAPPVTPAAPAASEPAIKQPALLPHPDTATGEALAAIPPAADTLRSPASRPILSLDSMLARVTTTPVRKKMRVVHINELDAAAAGQAADMEYKPFKIKFNNPSGFASQTIVNSTAQPERSSKN